MCQVRPAVELVTNCIFGVYPDQMVFQEDYNDAAKYVKDYTKTVNGRLADKSWLIGDSMTIADIFVAGCLSMGF